MPVRDYQAYARSDKGRAARERAHARYIDKRRSQKESQPSFDARPLARAIQQWRPQ